MQSSTSKSIVVAKVQRSRRTFTLEQQLTMLAYADRHGDKATIAQFKIVPSVLYRLKKMRGSGKLVMDAKVVREGPKEKNNMMIYHTAKHLRMLLRKRRKDTDEPDELEMYAWLLVKEIMA
jgi:hypothetical protein